MDLTKFVSADTPFYIVGFLAVVYYLQRKVSVLEAKVDRLQAQVTALHGIYTAVKTCPNPECRLKDLEPENVFKPEMQ